MKAGRGKTECQIEIVSEGAEIRGEHDVELRHSSREACIDPSQRLALRLIEIEHEAWLVELHPCRSAGSKLAQHLDVDREQRIEQREPVEAGIRALAKLQEGHGPDQHGPGFITKSLGFLVFLDRLATREAERLVGPKLRHHVMVVGVEPLRHFLRMDSVSMMTMRATALS